MSMRGPWTWWLLSPDTARHKCCCEDLAGAWLVIQQWGLTCSKHASAARVLKRKTLNCFQICRTGIYFYQMRIVDSWLLVRYIIYINIDYIQSILYYIVYRKFTGPGFTPGKPQVGVCLGYTRFGVYPAVHRVNQKVSYLLSGVYPIFGYTPGIP